MKTIFIIITRGVIARNILQIGVLNELKRRKDFRIVVFVPKGTPEFVKREAGGENVIFETFDNFGYSRFHRVFQFFLSLSLINRTSIDLSWHGSGKTDSVNRVAYVIAFPILCLLHILSFSRELMQWMEYRLYPDKMYDHFFQKYRPDLVFTTYVFSRIDLAFVKAARRFNAISINLPRGWDNLDKRRFQLKPDYLFLPNVPLTRYAKKYQGFKDRQIKVIGFPAFDIYRNMSNVISREEFCRERGFDPKRRILLYGSEGPWSGNDKELINTLIRYIKEDRFSSPCSLILRPYFGSIGQKPFEEFRGTPNVFVDDSHRLVTGFADGWYPTKEEVTSFASEIYHLDIMFCVASTLSLDAISLGKPVINIGYRAYVDENNRDATKDLYKRIFYRDLLSRGAISLVRSNEELLSAVNRYFAEPLYLAAERRRVRQEYCNLGGPKSSAEQITEEIVHLLGKK